MSVGALVQKPLTTLMSLKDITRPEDLAGKRVGTAGLPYQSAYLKTILAKAGVDPETVKETNVGFNLVPAMLSDKVDATLGAFWNYEGEDLKRRGRNPKILRMEKLGVPTYDELIMVARRKDLDEDFSSKLRRFLRATARGHQRLRANPETGVDALLKVDPGPRARAADRGRQRHAARLLPEDKDKPFGWQEPAEWDAYGDWMFESELLKQPAGRGSGADQRVPAGRGAGPADRPTLREQAGAGGDDQVRPRQALPLAVALEEAAHLGLVGARLRVPGGEPADELEEAEVAGRDAVVVALAVEREHLERPGADVRDRAQPRARRRRGRRGRSGPRRSPAPRGAAPARAGRRGRRSAARPARARRPRAGVGMSRSPECGQRRPSRATSRRWITSARSSSISCSVIDHASASQGSARRWMRTCGRERTALPITGSSAKRS